ncbi:MAG: helix-turn-helix domain-containing protein [Cytophagales bacterium]|nr:helix-turn-helix domain-containing protein [Cytophagales bacterium]
MPINRIKHYELYGERETNKTSRPSAPPWSNSFHFESIPQRSKHYNWEIEPHVHDSFLQILTLSRGHAHVVVNGKKTSLQSPSLICIPAQNVHSFQFSQDVDGVVITIAQQPIESMAKATMPELTPVLREPWLIPLGADSQADTALAALLDAIEHEWRVHSYGHASAGLSLLATLLIHVGRYAQGLAQMPSAVGVSTRKAQVVERFKTMVNEHFKTTQSVDGYAQRLGVSAGQLTRLTQEILEQSALAVIHARLLFEAQRELIYTPDSIKQIAARVGFHDAAYFSRFFRKQTGQTPRDYRKIFISVAPHFVR